MKKVCWSRGTEIDKTQEDPGRSLPVSALKRYWEQCFKEVLGRESFLNQGNKGKNLSTEEKHYVYSFKVLLRQSGAQVNSQALTNLLQKP